MANILKKLEGGDRRSVGRVDEVVAAPTLFETVFQGMLADDPLLRMRCADAIEKITLQHPEWLRPYKSQLVRRVALISQQEVRWHVAQLFSRLTLTARERRSEVTILEDYLNDESRIVKTFAMQALADIAEQDAELRRPIVRKLARLTRTGSPAMQSRGRKLLAKLKDSGQWSDSLLLLTTTH